MPEHSPPENSAASAGPSDAERAGIDRRCQELGSLDHTADTEAELVRALADPAWRVRSTAARVLTRLGERPTPSRAAMSALLDLAYSDQVAWSRHAATWSLCEMARADLPVAEALTAHPPARWDLFPLQLATRLPRGSVDPLAFLGALTDSAWQVRAAAATALGAQVRDASREQVATALERALGDDDPSVREAVADGLADVGGPGARAALLGMFDDGDAAVQARCLRALARLLTNASQPAKEAQGDADDADDDDIRAVLERALASQHARVRRAAAALAAQLGKSAVPLMDALLESLADVDYSVADNIGFALLDVARAAPETAPLLWRAVETRRAPVRVRALELVGQVAPAFPNPHTSSENVTRLLLTKLRGNAFDSATWLLRQVPLSHAPTLQVVREVLAGAPVKARWRALTLLRQSEKASQELIPELRRALHDPATRVRLAATGLVSTLGTGARPTLPEFVRRAFEYHEPVAHAAQRGLEQLVKSADLPPALADWLPALGRRTEADEFLLARLQREGLAPELLQRLQDASREHAAWHQRVGERRSSKHQLPFAAPAPLAADSSPIDWLMHAVHMAQARATVRISGKQTLVEVADRAAQREYAWHVGRLIELINASA